MKTQLHTNNESQTMAERIKRMPMLNGEAGSVMGLTLVVFMIVAVLSMTVLGISVNSIRLANRQRQAAEAFNIAESGSGLAVAWLQSQAYPPTGLTPFTPTPFANNPGMGAGHYTITVTPDSQNNVNYLKTYTILAVGTSGSISKSVEVVWRQGSFGRFAYFTDKETSSSGSAIWWKAGEVCDGPAFSNNSSGTNFQINYSGSTNPIFQDFLMAAGSSINYNPSAPSTDSTFRKIYSNGSRGYLLSVSPIALPPSSDAQKNAAWGATSGFPSSTGVYLRSGNTGGLYICGDAGVKLARDSSGRQQVIVTQGSNVTTVTISLSGTVTTSGPMGSGSATSSNVLPNGVIYCSGNITSLSGTVTDNVVSNGVVTTRSAWTIATDVNNNKDITVTNNIVYNTKPDKTLSATNAVNLAAGTLGLVAHNINISTSAPTNCEIDAVCLAGGSNTTDGSFAVQNYSTRTPVGNLTVLGGIIQKVRGAVGTFNASTGQTTTGYSKNYHYDPRLATDPPPYYPTTGTYDKLSWRVLPG